MNLLAGITARTGKDPGEQYSAPTAEFGTAYYTRIDAPATPEQKTKLEGADSGGSRPRIRDDVAHHSDLISLGVPR